jgi:sigma-B regulation protein RsbU (phosphoserine phosphatase)
MRVVPRIRIPKSRQIKRKLRQLRRHVTIARVLLAIELMLLAVALLVIYTGKGASALDRLGRRADSVAMAITLILFALFHVFIRKRIVPLLERYFLPAPYDERRILFDLGQEARAATNIDQLYHSIVSRIGEALSAENVSIFVGDDAGNYICRISLPETITEKAEQTGDKEKAVHHPRHVLGRDAFVVRRLQHLAHPLVIEPAELESWDKALSFVSAASREARIRERETLRQIKASLLAQIKIKHQLAGILSLGPRRGGHPYSTADKEMLMSVANQLAFVIENSKLAERMVAEERLRRELVLAAEVQQRLFPSRPPSSIAIELAGFCQPARGVGGDYYDFLSFGNGQIGIAIADVSGKGISAALLMSSVQASLRSQTVAYNSMGQSRDTVTDIVSALNRLLCESTGSATYVTFFYGQLDEKTRQLTYVNAGHNPPLLLRASGATRLGQEPDRGAETIPPLMRAVASSAADASSSVQVAGGVSYGGSLSDGYQKLDKGGPVVGMFDYCQYEQETIQLESGDIIVAYTDGVTEALSEDGEEFGEERLQEVLTAAAHLTASELRDSVVKRVQAWCAGAPQHDDLTFIIAKVK